MLAPFPWTTAPDPEIDDGNYQVVDAAGELGADCGIFGRLLAEQEANAAFIALAPRLLDSLRKSSGHVCGVLCSGDVHDIECVALTLLLREADMVGRGRVVEVVSGSCLDSMADASAQHVRT
jgi:hypothetical protein